MRGRAEIEIPEAELKEFCRRRHIRKLSLFGSVLSDGFRKESDVDVLVEFQPGPRKPGRGREANPHSFPRSS